MSKGLNRALREESKGLNREHSGQRVKQSTRREEQRVKLSAHRPQYDHTPVAVSEIKLVPFLVPRYLVYLQAGTQLLHFQFHNYMNKRNVNP